MITRSFLALRNLLIATWSVIVGYLLFALMESLILRGPVQPGVAAFVLLALAVALFFLARWAFPLDVRVLPGTPAERVRFHGRPDGEPIAGRPRLAAAAPVRFPGRPDEPLLRCPTCRSMMHLIGRNTGHGLPHVYLWACENDHGWNRPGESPGDPRFPWRQCNPAEMMEHFFG